MWQKGVYTKHPLRPELIREDLQNYLANYYTIRGALLVM